MIEVPDYIYKRSVVKQLYLKEESRHLFQKNAYSVSINREKSDACFYAESTDILYFKTKPILLDKSINKIVREILCAGGALTELRVELIFAGNFDEEELREFSISLKKLADKTGAEVKRVSVYIKEAAENERIVFISGRGSLKAASDAPWQRQRIFAGQEIILTGELGKSGMAELFNKNKEEIKSVYPKLYIEKMKHISVDRLPLVEVEAAPFYRTTAMLPLGEGGLYAGLWNLGEREEAGLIVYADRLKYEQTSIELSNYFNVNPLELNSAGSYLLVTDRGEELTYVLRKAGIEATCIGEVTKDKKRVIIFDDEERFIESPRYDF
jgi:hypothetical protein